MVKTMSSEELSSFLGNLYNYVKYMGENEYSFISKIYAVMTVEQTGSANHILIMRNITNCPSDFIMRSYDLKGSTIERKVWDNYQDIPEKINKTLKDTDFKNIEEKLALETKKRFFSFEQLMKDSEFLFKCKWLDYSLLVVKINWAGYSIENDVEEE
jgi:hypothetical protein